MVFLGCEHDPMLGFVVNLELRVIGAHVALPACRRQASDLDGRRVASVTGGAGADRPVGVRFADPVTLDAAADNRGGPFQCDEGIGGSLAGAGMELLRE